MLKRNLEIEENRLREMNTDFKLEVRVSNLVLLEGFEKTVRDNVFGIIRKVEDHEVVEVLLNRQNIHIHRKENLH